MPTSTQPTPIRHADDTLTDDQQAVLAVFTAFFERESPPERVRDAEPHGFDADLWKHLDEMRVVAMGIDAAAGGDGAGLIELVLLAEQWGRHLAPVPLVDAIVAARLIERATRLDTAATDLLAAVLDGRRLPTIALHPTVAGRRQLVPSAAVAEVVVALVGDDLVVSELTAVEQIPNQGHTPLAWVDPSAGAVTVIASGPAAAAAFAAALRDWQLLMAAALTGMAQGALGLGLEHARERIAFGVPIGSFQAVAHPLVDVAMNVEMARKMTRKAAWWADNDPEQSRELIPMAYYFAERAAVHAAQVGVHTLGGVGFTVESDVQLFFRRAKGWTLALGDPERRLDDLADELFGPVGSEPNSQGSAA